MLGLVVSACLSLVAVPQGLLNTITVVTGIGGGKQKLPLAMCNWPVWMAASGYLTLVPGTGRRDGDDDDAGFVDPAGFEQLWCPDDLPLPACHLALATVLKVLSRISSIVFRVSLMSPPALLQDGVPVYVFPCLETVVAHEAAGGSGAVVWHNRGLNSVPLGSTWMGWGTAGPPGSLVLASFSRELPPQDEAAVAEDEPDATVCR